MQPFLNDAKALVDYIRLLTEEGRIVWKDDEPVLKGIIEQVESHYVFPPPPPEHPLIRGRCHDDGHNVVALFDATPWFEQASDERIIELTECAASFLPEQWDDIDECWGQDYPSDAIAIFMADHNDSVAEMFKFIALSRERLGFECYIHPLDTIKWIEEHRPHLISRI